MLDVYDVYARNHDSFRSVCESLHFEETWRASDWIMIVWFDELLSGRWCCQVIQMLWCATHGFSRGEAWKADEMSEMLWTYRRLKNLAACTKMILNVSKCIEMYPNVSKRTISCFESAWSALDVAEVNFPIEITYDEKKFSFQVMRFGSQIPMVYPEKIKRQLDLAKLLSCVVAADFSSENYQLFHFFFPESSVLGHRLWGRVQTPFPSPSMARPWRPRPGDGSGLWLDAAAVSMARQKFWNQQLLDRLIYTHIYIDCLVMSCCIYTNIHICNNI